MSDDQKQGEIKTSDELQSEQIQKDQNHSEVAQQNADNGAPEGQGVADNPDEPLQPDYTGTMDTTDT